MTSLAAYAKTFAPPCAGEVTCLKLFHSVASLESGRCVYSGEDTRHFLKTWATVLDLVQDLERKRREAQNLLQISKNRVYKKWKGFKPEQRLQFLVKHCPDLQSDDFFDRADSGQIPLNKLRSAANSFLLHQFSLDKMKDDWTAFLALIQGRTEFGSEAWLPWDRDSLTKHWFNGALVVPFSTNCVVVRGPRYGHLIPWNPRMVHQRDALPVQYMLLVLQSQKLVSDFVLNALAGLMEAAGGPGKSHLWDQFIQNKPEPTVSNDVQFPLVHAFSVSPVVTMETIINMIRTYSEAHEDKLARLQSDLPFFLQRVQFHRDVHKEFKKTLTKESTQKVESKELSCAEFRALMPEFETRLLWHMILDIFERLNEALAPDKHEVADGHEITDEHDIAERMTREAHVTVQSILLARLTRIKVFILTSDFSKRRIAAVAASVLKKRTVQVHPTKDFGGNLLDLRGQSLADALDIFTDAELLEEDWILWCIDRIGLGLPSELPLLRRLLQCLRRHEELVEEMPHYLLGWLDEVAVLCNVWQYLQYPTMGAEVLTTEPWPSDEDQLLRLWYGPIYDHEPDTVKIGGKMEKQGADLKLVRPPPRKDKQWLARSDHCFAQFADLHRTAVDAYLEILAHSKSKEGIIPREHMRNLLLQHDHNGRTPISDAERTRLTEAHPLGPRPRSGFSPTPLVAYAPLPQEPEEKFSWLTASRRGHNVPDLQSLRKNTTTPQRLNVHQDRAESSQDPRPISLSSRAFQVAEQLFSAAPREGSTTFADIQVFMADAGFSCKALPGAARLFQLREMEGYGPIQGHKSITIHELHKAKYVPSQLGCLKRQVKKRFDWSMASFEKRE